MECRYELSGESRWENRDFRDRHEGWSCGDGLRMGTYLVFESRPEKSSGSCCSFGDLRRRQGRL